MNEDQSFDHTIPFEVVTEYTFDQWGSDLFICGLIYLTGLYELMHSDNSMKLFL